MSEDEQSSVGGAVEADLGLALSARQFFLVYQPTIDLQTGAFTGVEALLRWRHPTRGVVAPDGFIAALEASGQMVQVGAWVLSTACRQGAEWHSMGHRFSVSVNVSASQLASATILDDVGSALASSGFDPAHLVLELTEDTLVGAGEGAVSILARLKALGVRLAVDDFGTGAAPFEQIAMFPVDAVKIDRACIATISVSHEAAEKVHALVQMGKELHLETIAAGIEDADQQLALQVEQVDAGQGYHFFEPHEADEVSRFLEDFSIFSGKPL